MGGSYRNFVLSDDHDIVLAPDGQTGESRGLDGLKGVFWGRNGEDGVRRRWSYRLGRAFPLGRRR